MKIIDERNDIYENKLKELEIGDTFYTVSTERLYQYIKKEKMGNDFWLSSWSFSEKQIMVMSPNLVVKKVNAHIVITD